MSDEERFWGKVGEPDHRGCREWLGGRDKDGYGKFKADGKTVKAHRYSLYLATGTVGEEACHTCDNPPCVNPDHLVWGSKSDNMKDRAEKGRQAGGKVGSVSEFEKMDRMIDRLLKEKSNG